MQTLIRLSQDTQRLLRCPVCQSPLARTGDEFTCQNAGCAARYPIVNGVPILINEANSLFSIGDYLRQKQPIYSETLKSSSRLGRLATRLLPSLSRNVNAAENYRQFAALVRQENPQPRVLVIGGRIAGQGMAGVLDDPTIEFVESDIAFGPRTALICDAHDIPFEDGSFDGVIAQAVLEHVLDPQRCVTEIHRVLNDNGLVYAETPFIQQVHGGGYDFTRFTYLGHRRLFRMFEEVSSGAAAGPGMALAWSYQYFLLSFFTGRLPRALAVLFARLTAFWLKYLDRYLVNRPAALDAASSYYFLGRRRDQPFPDRDLITLYWRNRP